MPSASPRDGIELYLRNETPFLQLEVKREHMSLDLWLPTEQLDEARASGIARAHPFLGEEAVKVRFERAEDLSKVARWLEASYDYAPERGRAPPKPPKVQDAPIATPPPPGSRSRNRDRDRAREEVAAEAPEAPAKTAAPKTPKKKLSSSAARVRPAVKKAAAKKPASKKKAAAKKKPSKKAPTARSVRAKPVKRRKKA